MDEPVAWGSPAYWACLAILAVARGADFLSTWIATPGLVLEGNPIARRLGWRWGAVLNVGLCVLLPLWPLTALIVATTSVLVAARNFQSAWLMHSMGEVNYRDWFVGRLEESGAGLFLFCLFSQAALVGLVGGGLVLFSDNLLIPFAVGVGILLYGVAVVVYSLLAFWRIRRSFS
jgi:hypothetical protein